MLRSSYDFLLDFDSDPFGKTFEVHWPTWANAFARIEQKIDLLIMFLKAYLAGVSFFIGIVSKLQDIFIKEGLWIFQWFFLFVCAIEQLTDVVLNSSQFQDHPRNWIWKDLLSLYPTF
jgi:hypothetical protein